VGSAENEAAEARVCGWTVVSAWEDFGEVFDP
jgi:hypothetical protein